MTKRIYWSKEKIINDVLTLQNKGECLNTNNMIKNHSKLYGAARTYFGSWRNLINELGLDYDEILLKNSDTHWNKEKIITMIKELKEKGENLRSDYTQKERTALHSAAVRYFGSWGNAIEEAGLSYEKEVKKILWDKKIIIKKMIELEDKNISLSSSNGQKNYMELFQASCRLFGSWANAVTASGIDYSKHRKQNTWSKEKILSEMNKFYNEYGTLNVSKVLKHYSKL